MWIPNWHRVLRGFNSLMSDCCEGYVSIQASMCVVRLMLNQDVCVDVCCAELLFCVPGAADACLECAVPVKARANLAIDEIVATSASRTHAVSDVLD